MSEVSLSRTALANLLISAAEMGAKRVLIARGEENPMLSWTQACKQFGQAPMMMWKKQGRLNPIQQGMNATKKYYVQDLLALSLVSERHSYLTMEERRAK